MENTTNVKMGKHDTLRMASIHDFGKNNNPNGNGSGNAGATNGSSAVVVSQAPSKSQGNGQGDDIDMSMLVNYNELAKKGKFSEALFRDAQIMQVLSVLSSKKKPNALLIGEAGVGKTQIVEEIARRLVNGDPIVSAMLKDAVIYELSLNNIVSGASFVGQLEEKVKNVIEFAQNAKNNVILFIDEIHQIAGSTESNPTYTKIAQQLKPALGRGHLRVIGATTTQEATSFMADPALNRRWQDVQVPELSPEQTEEIILNIRDAFQKHHGVILPDNVVEQAVAIGDEYKQYGSHRPDSTITLIDKAMADARIKRIKLQEDAKTNPQLQQIITAQPRPILNVKQLKKSALSLLTGDEKMYEQNAGVLESTLDAQIIGQETAKTAVVDAVKRLGLRLTKRKRPVSFLFAGPSGTGKTEIAKQVTEAVFGSKDRMVYINMSEFSNPASMTRIIGSSAGYVGSDSKQELPFDTLENNPYQLVLLDEFEKAHTEVQRFFMQALDEGVVKTNRNKEIDFSRTIIIATTNAGVIDMNKRTLGFTQEEVPEHSNEDIIRILQSSFDTELLNRFEKLIAFTPIKKEDYTKILAVKYNQLIAEAQANRKDLVFAPDHIDIDQANGNDKLLELAEESYTPSSNGRPAERTIREYIENTILDNPNATQFDLL